MNNKEQKAEERYQKLQEFFDNPNGKFNQIYSEAFKYRSLLKELSLYELEKLRDLASVLIDNKLSRLFDIISNNPEYPYPPGVEEDELYLYWDERMGNPYKKRLALKNDVIQEINSRINKPTNKHYTTSELKEWANKNWDDIQNKTCESDNLVAEKLYNRMVEKFGAEDARKPATLKTWKRGYKK